MFVANFEDSQLIEDQRATELMSYLSTFLLTATGQTMPPRC